MEKMQDEAAQLSHILHSTRSNFKDFCRSVVESIVTTQPKFFPQQGLRLFGRPVIAFTKAHSSQDNAESSACIFSARVI